MVDDEIFLQDVDGGHLVLRPWSFVRGLTR